MALMDSLLISCLLQASPFVRGDVNQDGAISIDDAIATLSHLYQLSPASFDCMDAADANDDGEIDLADAVTIVFDLFLGQRLIAQPWTCGSDSSIDALSCTDYLPCGIPSNLTNTLGMEFVYIPAGSFLMGSPASERGRQPDEALHLVHLECGFYMGSTEVTQKQYLEVMGTNPSWINGRRDGIDYGIDLARPVDMVSWFDAMSFCRKLSNIEGKHYRLPTESEWEYACRAGTSTRFWFGDMLECADAWCEPCPSAEEFMWACSGRINQHVALKRANPWGLYDIHDNSYEWCLDWYGPYPVGEVINPVGPKTGTRRVYRNWSIDFSKYRAAARGSTIPDARNSPKLGFRVVLEICHLTPD